MPTSRLKAALSGALVCALLVACGEPQRLRSEDTLEAAPGLTAPVQQSPTPEPEAPVKPVPPALLATLTPELAHESDSIARSIRDIKGVAAVARVALGHVRTESETVIADVSAAAVDPTEFRPLSPSVTAHADFVWDGLRGKEIFFTHEDHRMLGVQPGKNIALSGPAGTRPFRIGGVASNGIPNLGGVLMSLNQAAAIGLGPPTLILVGLEAEAKPDQVRKTLKQKHPTLRFDLTAATTRRAFVTGEVASKLFGTFNYSVNPDATITPDAEWVRKYVTTGNVPILGRVRCHRLMFPQLSAALGEVESRGLKEQINLRDYGGCYNARLIRGEDPNDPHSHLSMHAWGLAVDLNVSTNQMGATPTMNPEVVSIFESWGFRWGGRWSSRPDGMHFELAALIR